MQPVPEPFGNNRQNPFNQFRAVIRGGGSKSERYDWRPLGPLGEYAMLAKEAILLDTGYQREPDHAKALAIARDFQWPIFGTILVVVLESVCYCFDGGHRLAAALLRSEITLVPCMVYECHSREEAAKLFLAVNNFRKSMNAHQKHVASVCAKDEADLAIEKIGSLMTFAFVGSLNSPACERASGAGNRTHKS